MGCDNPLELHVAMTPPPFRTHLRIALDADVEALNERDGHTHARAYEPTVDARARVDHQSDAGGRRRASWVTHPDERVLLTLIDRCQSELFDGAAGKDFRGRLYRRVIQAADRDGEIWNLVIDHAACQALFQRGFSGLDLFRRAKKLAGWLQEADDPDEIRPLLAFQYPGLHAVVARHAVALDNGLLRTLLDEPEAAVGLARNEHLSDAQVEQVRDLALDRTASLVRRRRGGGETKRGGWTPRERAAVEALEAFGRHGRLGRTSAERLLGLFADEPGQDKGIAAIQGRLLSLISHLDEGSLTADQLTRLARLSDVDSPGVDYRLRQRIVEHPMATKDLWRQWAHDPKMRHLHGVMVRRGLDRLDDEEIRSGLRSSPSFTALSNMARRAGPGDVDALLAELLPMIRSDRPTREGGRRAQYAAGIIRRNLLEHMDAGQLKRFHRKVARDTDIAEDLMGHPAADEELLLQILDGSPSFELRKSLLGYRKARSCQALRWKLARSTTSTELIRNLLRDARGEELRYLMEKYRSQDEVSMIVMLRQIEGLSDDQARGLDPELLAPMLASDNASLRQRALFEAARLGGEPPSSGRDAPSARRSQR